MAPDAAAMGKRLWTLWSLNARLGWPERARGLYYWLGFEYALVLRELATPTGSRIRRCSAA